MTEAFLKYLKFEKRSSSHTVLSYENDLGQFAAYLTSTYESNPLEASFQMIRSWIVSLSESGLENTSINRKIACLRSFYKFLLKDGAISKDPMTKIRVLKTQKRLPSFVRENEMVNVLDDAQFEQSFAGLRDKLVLELLYGTGIRRAELVGLKESDVDVRNHTIKVLGKRNKERIIPFGSSIIPLIKAYKQIRNREVERKEHGLLLVKANGEKCYPEMINKIVKKYLTQYSTSEKKSPHVLRHTYATHLLNKGADINAVKDLLGHTSLAATQVYTHNSLEKIKKIFDQAHPKA